MPIGYAYPYRHSEGHSNSDPNNYTDSDANSHSYRDTYTNANSYANTNG